MLGFTFLPSFGSERMGSRFGLQYSQFPSLWPRSFVSCQAQISHSATHSVSQSLPRSPRQVGCTVPLYYCLYERSAKQAGHRVPLCHSLWVHVVWDRRGARFSWATVSGCAVWDQQSTRFPSATHSGHAQVKSPLGPPAAAGEFLTKQLPAILNKRTTQPPFSTSPETIQVRVWHGPTPPFFRYCQHPNFSGVSIHSPSGYVPPPCVSHFISTSPSKFQHPGPS